MDETRPVSIVTKATGKEDAPCKVICTNPAGQTSFVPTKKVPGGYESAFTPKQQGPHKLKIELDNKEVPKSPVTANVVPKLDVKKLEVKGLEKRKWRDVVDLPVNIVRIFCLTNDDIVKLQSIVHCALN